jgi:DtxR family Mn-dependent transcriptional regulator
MHRTSVEDILRAMLECEYRKEDAKDANLSALSGQSREHTLAALGLARTLMLVRPEGDGWRLEDSGRRMAVRVMRAHRLTETQLARESGLPASEWHEEAQRVEHKLSTQEIDHLADKLGNPRFDPHGDAIPTREGYLPVPEEQALLAWPENRHGVIAHIEDEPPVLFRELVRLGLYAGMRLTRIATGRAETCTVSVEARQYVLSPELASMIRMREALGEENDVPQGACRLEDIPLNGSAEVLMLLSGCMGSERSRLLDLGFVPGSVVEHNLNNPLHGSAAYFIRGTLIALRREQSEQVLVMPLPASEKRN